MIGKTKDGYTVIDRHNSHIHSTVTSFLPEALNKIEVAGQDFIIAKVEFNRFIGMNLCVETDSSDEIVFAKRPNRKGYTRFVKSREAELSTCATLILKADEILYKTMIIITAFIGDPAEPEPWDAKATNESLEFWSNHALVWGLIPVVPGTETEESQW